MRKLVVFVVILAGVCGSMRALSAATQCRVHNGNSSAVMVEIRVGHSDDCLQNGVWWTGTIRGNSDVNAPYGGSISKVCVRKRIGDAWGTDWFVAYCPSDDNDNCRINL